jgi:dihydrofolate synthase/folylpolyglutamate synthase
VVGEVPPEALSTIERHAAEAGAPIIRVPEVAAVENARNETAGQTFDVRTARARYAIRTPALGGFQRSNAATAIAALECLPPALAPGVGAVEAGFSGLTIPGRMEVAGGEPPVVFDIAHNVEKAERLVAALRERFPERNLHYVVAVGEGKDAREILRALRVPNATFRFTSFALTGRRSLPARQLAEYGRTLGIDGPVFEEPADALRAAVRDAAPGDAIVVTGSTFVVAGLREWYATTAAR